ncbi:MAG: ferrochelatase, partial [Campylobacterales bacterium]|nr:ferrochelatase [Campylobacterales bacterium]
MKKKGLVLLNMGGARSKEELQVFLTNMFNDKNILTIPVDLIRSMVAFFIVTFRLNKAWQNYEAIGGKSPLHDLTDDLVAKLQAALPDYFVTTAMRYTSPFAQTAIARLKEQGVEDVILLPLYPQFSTTTTKSSVEDFKEKAGNSFKSIKTVKPFYKNDTFNSAICKQIIEKQNQESDYHLIFSAHGLPQKVVDKGDPYQKQVEKHVEILKEKLERYPVPFKSINLA